MTRFLPLIHVVMQALLVAGCINPHMQKQTSVKWSTIEPSGVAVSERVSDAGPFHLWFAPSLAVINFSVDYDGDDSPWLDRTEDFRQKIADAMDGYAPENITMADMAVARNSFMSERLGSDYVWKEEGCEGKTCALLAGNKWEGIYRYASIRDTMFPQLFVLSSKSASGRVVMRVVDDVYRVPNSETSTIWDVSVYVFRIPGSHPIPKATFTEMDEEVAMALAIEGTTREVPGGRAMDVQTPRGRMTVYLPYNLQWLANQHVWNVGFALVQALNNLPDDMLRAIKGNEEQE